MFQIVKQLKSYNFKNLYIYILVEYDNKTDYGVKSIVVPKDYKTDHHSKSKHRALHYFSEWLKKEGYGKETYVVHLDDDSVVSKKYLEYVMGMTAEAGQGAIRLRTYGHHLFSTLADFGRVVDCDTYCAFFNSRSTPFGVHGEGLVIRADVEEEIGWDYQPTVAEDFIMGQNIYSKGYKFDFIPGGIYIAPPTNTRDFYNQRRRWHHHFFESIHLGYKLHKSATAWFAYQYSMGWAMALGLGIWIYVLIARPSIYPILFYITTFNLIVSFGLYQYAAYYIKKLKYHLLMLLLQIPVTVYYSLTFFYYLLKKPKSDIYIKKV